MSILPSEKSRTSSSTTKIAIIIAAVLVTLSVTSASLFIFIVYKKRKIKKSCPEIVELKPMEESSVAICMNDPIFIEVDYERSV